MRSDLFVFCMIALVPLCLVFFFFQAEDGIRDDLVTGVQTCALPISCCDRPHATGVHPPVRNGPKNGGRSESSPRSGLAPGSFLGPNLTRGLRAMSPAPRSEERRVGKECSSQWPADAFK